MNPNRSWPGVPNRYSRMLSSMVIRPKSIATVVVVFASPAAPAVSIPTAAVVIAASVVSGSISDNAPIKVVLPTPNPPETRIFTGTGGRRSAGRPGGSPASDTIVRSTRGPARRAEISEGGDTGDQPFQEDHVVRLLRSD